MLLTGNINGGDGWHVYKKDDAGAGALAGTFALPAGCRMTGVGASLGGSYQAAGWCDDTHPGEAFFFSDEAGFNHAPPPPGFESVSGKGVTIVADQVGFRRSPTGKNAQWGAVSPSLLAGPASIIPSPCTDCSVGGVETWSTTVRNGSSGSISDPGFYFWGETTIDALHLAPYIGTVTLGVRGQEASLLAERAALQKQRDEIVRRLDKLEGTRAELATVEQELEQAQQDRQDLGGLLTQVEQQLADCNVSGSCTPEQVTALELQRALLGEQIEALDATIVDLETRRQDLVAFIAVLAANEPEMRQQLAAIDAQLVDVQLDIDVVQAEIATLEQEIDEAQVIAELSGAIVSAIDKDLRPVLTSIVQLGVEVDTCDWLMPKDDCTPCLAAACEATPDGLASWGNFPSWVVPRDLAQPLGRVADANAALRRLPPDDLLPAPIPEACGGPRACGKGVTALCAVPCPAGQECPKCDNGQRCLTCLPGVSPAEAVPAGGVEQCRAVVGVLAPVYAACLEQTGQAVDCAWARPPECEPADACGIATYTSPVFPEGDGERVLEWKRATIEDAAELEGTALRYSLLDGASGEPIAGFTDLASPADGVLDLAGIDPDEHPRLQLQARFQGVGNTGFLAIPNALTNLDACAADPACWSFEPVFLTADDVVYGTLRVDRSVVVRWSRGDGMSLVSPYDDTGRIGSPQLAGFTEGGVVVGNYELYDPDVCGGVQCDGVFRNRGFIWDAALGWRDLIEVAGGVSSDGEPLLRVHVGGINVRGEVVGAVQLGTPDGNNPQAWMPFVWSQSGGFRLNEGLVFGDGWPGRNFRIGDGGLIAGAYQDAQGAHRTFTWDPSAGTTTFLPFDTQQYVVRVNARGTVIGNGAPGGAWIQHDGQLVALEPPPSAVAGPQYHAADINDDDVVVGYLGEASDALDVQAFRWTPDGGVEAIAQSAAAFDVTPSGSILLVENTASPGVGDRARPLQWLSIFGPGGRQRLTAPSGFSALTVAEQAIGYAMNDRNHVIGVATRPDVQATGVHAQRAAASGTGFFWVPPDISTFALFGWQADFRSDRHPALGLEAEVEDTCRETITNRVEVGTTSAEVGVANNTSEVEVVVNRADLAVEVNLGRRAVLAGESLDVTFTWKNKGPGTARDVSVTAELPATGDAKAFSEVLLDGVTLGPRASGSVTRTLTNIAGAEGSDIAASATVTSPTIDCEPANDSDTAAAVIGSFPNGWVRLSAPPGVTVAQAFPLVVSWGNDGNISVSPVDVSVTLPEGVEVVDAAGATVTGSSLVWTLADKLEAGMTDERTLTLRWNDCDPSRTRLAFAAQIRLGAPDLDGFDNEVTASATIVAPAASLQIAGTTSRRVLRTGESVTALIVFGNPGSAVVRDPEVLIDVPAGLRVVPGSGSPEVEVDGDGDVRWQADLLAPGAEGGLRFELTAEQPGTFALGLGAQGLGACPVTGEPIAVEVGPVPVGPVGPVVDVLAAADRSGLCAQVGEVMTWSFTVANHGNGTARAGELTTQVPDGLAVGERDGATEVPGEPGRLRWLLGDLPPGAALTLSYQATIVDSRKLGRHVLMAAAEVRFGVEGEPKARVVSSAPALLTLGCDAGLVVSKRWTAGCAIIGTPQGLEIRVQNAGTVAVADAVLIDRMGHLGGSAGVGLVPAAGVEGWDASTRTLTRGLGVIAPGAEKVVSIPLAIGATVAAGTPLYDVAMVAIAGQPARLSNAVIGAVLACDDQNVCTNNTCEPARGCVFEATTDGVQCDDDDACTTDDACAAGACLGGAPPDCDDDNVCTDDGCDVATGCTNTDVLDGSTCDDGDLCTPVDSCQAGLCAGGSAIVCDTPGDCQEVGVCDPGSGACTFAAKPDGTACQDGDACTLRDVCGGGACQAGFRAFGECRCGDGWITPGEACDDANGLAGDGCSASCTEEPGWRCFGFEPAIDNVVPGGPCELFCGNRKLDGGETCDDGNASAGDGCGATCRVEPGYACDVLGALCTSVCGDGVQIYPEHCDDGGLVGGDGCSATCQVETGWDCAEACSPVCGDSVRVGGEGCDDGNTRSDDGCSAACEPEQGWDCVGAACVVDRSIAAVDDVAETYVGQSVDVTVVTNDRGADVRVVDLGVAAHGDVEQLDAFTVRYTPAPDFEGEDAFDYDLVDAAGDSDTAVVTITVIGVDLAQALVVTHLAQSCDATTPGRQIDMAITGGTGDYLLDLVPIPPVVRTVTAGKTAIVQQVSDLAMMPRPALVPVLAPVAPLAARGALPSGSPPAPSALVRSPIQSQNVVGNIDCPTPPKPLTAVVDTATVIDGRAVVDVLANDLGVGLRLASIGTPAHGEASEGSGGTIVYRPVAGWAGVDRFVYTVSDGAGHTDGAEVTITVPASAGFDAVDDRAATHVATEVLIDIVANDIGAASFLSLGAAAHGSATRKADGRISYVPVAGFVGEDTFTYRVGRDAVSDEARVTVVVAKRGDCVPFVVSETRPTCLERVPFSGLPGSPGARSLRAYDVAFDLAGGSGGFVTGTLPSGPSFVSVPVVSGDKFRFDVKDAFNPDTCAPVVVSGKITCPAAPEFNAVDDAYATKSLLPVLLRPIENDLGTGLSTSAIDSPKNGTLEALGDGVYRYTSFARFVGTETLAYSVRDAADRRDGGTIKIVVDAHSPKVCANFAAQDLIAQCQPDGGAFDVRFSILGGSGVFEVDGQATSERTFEATVDSGKTFSVNVIDRAAPCAAFTVVAKETCTASAQVAANPDAVTLAPNTTASFSPLANDVGERLTVTSIGAPSRGVIVPRNGAYLYIPTGGFVGIDSAVYQVRDADGVSASSTIVFYVHAPSAEVAGCQSCALSAIDDRVSALVGDVVTRDVFANDLGPGLELVSYLGTTRNPLTFVGGRLTYHADREATDERILYKVRDVYGFEATATVLLSVGPAAPCLADAGGFLRFEGAACGGNASVVGYKRHVDYSVGVVATTLDGVVVAMDSGPTLRTPLPPGRYLLYGLSWRTAGGGVLPEVGGTLGGAHSCLAKSPPVSYLELAPIQIVATPICGAAGWDLALDVTGGEPELGLGAYTILSDGAPPYDRLQSVGVWVSDESGCEAVRYLTIPDSPCDGGGP